MSFKKITLRLEENYHRHALLMTQLFLLRENLLNNLYISIQFEYLRLLTENKNKLLALTVREFNLAAANFAEIKENGELVCSLIEGKHTELKNVAILFNIVLSRFNPANKSWPEYYNLWAPSSKLNLINSIIEGIDAFNLEYKKTAQEKNLETTKDSLQYHSYRLTLAPHLYDFEKNILQDCKNIRDQSREYLSQTGHNLWKKLDTIYHEYWAILKKVEHIITRMKKAAENKKTIHLPQAQPYIKWSPSLFTIPENREKHLLMLHSLDDLKNLSCAGSSG